MNNYRDHSLDSTIKYVRDQARNLENKRARDLKPSYVHPDILWYVAADDVLSDEYTTDDLAAIIAEGINHVVGNVFEREKAALVQIARRIVCVLVAPETFDETVQMRRVDNNTTIEMPTI